MTTNVCGLTDELVTAGIGGALHGACGRRACGLAVRPTQAPLAEVCVTQETEALSTREAGIPCPPRENNSVHHLKT